MKFFKRKTDIRTHIRKKAKMEAGIAEAEAEAEESVVQARLRGRAKAKARPSGGGFGAAFKGFQSYAQEFTKREEKAPSGMGFESGLGLRSPYETAVKKKLVKRKRRRKGAKKTGRIIQIKV